MPSHIDQFDPQAAAAKSIADLHEKIDGLNAHMHALHLKLDALHAKVDADTIPLDDAEAEQPKRK